MKNVIFPEKINASNCAAIYGVLTGGRYGREPTVGVWEYYGGTTYTIVIYNPHQYQLKRFIFKRNIFYNTLFI